MAAAPFGTAFEALVRPLEFVAGRREGGADRLRDLEQSVRGACGQLLALSLPRDLRAVLLRVERSFRDPLEGEDRSAAVQRALDQL